MKIELSAVLLAIAAILVSGCAETRDATTTGVIKTKLAADGEVKAYTIEVDTRNGVVTLKGNTDSRAAHDRAVRLARETDGVVEVKDMITVRDGEARGDAPDTPRTLGEHVDDAAITARVKARLLDDPAVKGLRIDVDTRDGVVYLTGSVGSAEEREKAVAIARSTEGVKDVEPNLN